MDVGGWKQLLLSACEKNHVARHAQRANAEELVKRQSEGDNAREEATLKGICKMVLYVTKHQWDQNPHGTVLCVCMQELLQQAVRNPWRGTSTFRMQLHSAHV